MSQTRKQELQEELNNIRAQEIEAKLKESEELESSAIAIQQVQAAKAKSELNIATTKADAELKVEMAKSDHAQKKIENKSHMFVTMGDFLLKFGIAFSISAAFLYIVYTGSMASVDEELIGGTSKTSSLFNLLSVVGPLFGMVLNYYFGKGKSSINGE